MTEEIGEKTMIAEEFNFIYPDLLTLTSEHVGLLQRGQRGSEPDLVPAVSLLTTCGR